jgi:hypothetical protein
MCLISRTAAFIAALNCGSAAGLPPGVFNLVHGLGGEAGAALVAHPGVKVVSFTGGTATGKIVAAAAAPLFKKISLELGGKVGPPPHTHTHTRARARTHTAHPPLSPSLEIRVSYACFIERYYCVWRRRHR